MHQVRPPAVAGAFYPGQGSTLSNDVAALLAKARLETDTASKMPKALIVPHAGYIYSGATAARAYAQLAAGHATVRRVFLLGPCTGCPSEVWRCRASIHLPHRWAISKLIRTPSRPSPRCVKSR